jgi:drug/metabolite transporter (DMT)-like permease
VLSKLGLPRFAIPRHVDRFPMQDPHHPQRAQAIVMLVLANLFWAVSFPIVKTLLLVHERLVPAAGPWFSTIYTMAPRFVIAVGLLVLWRPRMLRSITRNELKQGVTLGLFTATGMFLQNDALQFTAASTSAFLTQFYAIMIPIFLAVKLRRNPGTHIWICCVLVLAGVALLGKFDFRAMRFGRGEWETLLCSIFFMGQILTLERKEFAGNDSLRLTLVMFATEGVVLWAIAIGLAPDAHTLLVPWQSAPWVGLTVILTLVSTIAAFLLMNTWQPKVTATEAGLIYCVEPIFGSLMALFLPAIFSVWALVNYPNEEATWTLLVGGGLITLANVVLQMKPPPDA